MKQRLETFDIARALCIVLVVVGHYNPDNAPMWWKDVNHFIYSFHMPVFLFISGFIYAITLKRGNYTAFIWKKVKRLLVPYLSASLIVVSIKLLTQGCTYVEHPVSVGTYLEIFYLPAAGYYLWFVWALFIMFSVTHISQSKLAHIGLLGISIVAQFVPFELPDAFCLRQFQEMWVYFMLGVILADRKLPEVFDSKWFWVVSITLYTVVYITLGTDGKWQHFTVATFGIGMTISISSMLKGFNWIKQKILFPIAVASFTIYLYHTTFSGFAKATLAKAPLSDSTFILEAIFVIACGVIFPMVIHKLLKKSKKFKWTIGL